MKLVVAGEGAFGRQHLRSLRQITGVTVVGLVGGDPVATQRCAEEFQIPAQSLDLADMFERADVDAVVLATPTPLHAAQALQCLRAGKHVQVEIPIADRLSDAQALAAAAEASGLVAAAGHTRRFNASHRWMHERLKSGALILHHLDVQTFFFRRSNSNALGEPRTWTDHLLWHHACHTVDLFQHQTGETASIARGVQGPLHPQLGIAMDMSVQMKAPSGPICTLGLSFNNQGPLGTTFRYICDGGTYVARYDELIDGDGHAVDLSYMAFPTDGVLAQDQNFIDAIRTGAAPLASIKAVLAAYETLDRIQSSLG